MSKVTNGRPKISGAVYIADSTTTLPTDATTALASGFTSLGYVSEDGLTNDNSPETETIKAWGGAKVLTVQTDRPDTFTFKLIDALDVNVLKAVYGDDNATEATSAITVKATSDEMESKVFVFDMIMKGAKAKRIVVPAGVVTSVGTISYKDNEAVGYELTITCDAVTDGNQYVTHYEYIA